MVVCCSVRFDWLVVLRFVVPLIAMVGLEDGPANLDLEAPVTLRPGPLPWCCYG